MPLRAGTVPKGARLRRYLTREDSGSLPDGGTLEYGIPWRPKEFWEEAMKLQHPFDAPARTADRHKAAVYTILTEGVESTKLKRRRTL